VIFFWPILGSENGSRVSPSRTIMWPGALLRFS
jgi:hypothetical protein